MAGVEGEGVGGAVAIGDGLEEAEDGAREDVGLLAFEDECAVGRMLVLCWLAGCGVQRYGMQDGEAEREG